MDSRDSCRSTVRGLCFGRAPTRLESPSAAVAAGSGRGQERSLLSPPLAVRAGVDAVECASDQEHQAGRRRQPHQKREKKPPEPRPTHFLALQVSQYAGVTTAITTVQESIRQHSPHLSKACVEAATAHLTLGVMALPGLEEQQQGREVLAALAGPLAELALLAPVEVQLEGLSHFNNQVLYLDVRQDSGLERLMRLAAAARAHLHQHGLLLQAEQRFVPHVTVAKTSKLQGGRFGGKRGGRRGGHHWREERRAKQQRQEREQADAQAELEIDCQGDAQLLPEPVLAAEVAGILEAAAGSAAEQATVAALATEAAAGPSQPPQGDQQRQQQQQQLDYRHIPAEAWSQHADIVGGPVVLAEVQLCAMQGRRVGEYYPVLCSLPLVAVTASDHDATAAGGVGAAAASGPELPQPANDR